MLVNIYCNTPNTRIARRKFLNAAPFCFQFCNLRFVQLFRHHLEPQIDIFFIDFLVHKASFINQRDNRLVLDAILNRVFMNQLAELLQGVLFVFQKRRAGKADVAGVREYSSHLGRERTVVRTVAFIDKDKNIPGIILDALIIYRIELVYNRSDDVGLAFVNQVAKVLSACSASRRQACVRKRLCNLLVKFLTVGHDNHFGTYRTQFFKNILGNHHHGKRLTRALRMPNDTTLTVTRRVIFGNGFHNRLYRKELLITANLFDVGIVNDKILRELAQAFFFEQRNQRLVLFRRDTPRNNLIDKARLPFRVLLTPYIPEFFPGTHSRVLDRILVCRDNHLHVFEQLRNILRFLVADILLDTFFFRNVGCLAFDNGKRNPVHKHDNIGAGVFLFVPAVAREFLRHMENVVVEIVPIDIVQVETFRCPIHQFFLITLAEHQGIVNAFARFYQSLGQWHIKFCDSPFDIFGRKLISNAIVFKLVDFLELLAEDFLEQYIVLRATLLGSLFGRNVSIAQLRQHFDCGVLARIVFKHQV